mmetsp:Transcript_15651/g.41254  ORF Transcript_15651/g.41254 Transcript_15651/m.41254 type:complete len:289 (-) Transcript_15651:181-1047(-)
MAFCSQSNKTTGFCVELASPPMANKPIRPGLKARLPTLPPYLHDISRSPFAFPVIRPGVSRSHVILAALSSRLTIRTNAAFSSPLELAHVPVAKNTPSGEIATAVTSRSCLEGISSVLSVIPRSPSLKNTSLEKPGCDVAELYTCPVPSDPPYDTHRPSLDTATERMGLTVLVSIFSNIVLREKKSHQTSCEMLPLPWRSMSRNITWHSSLVSTYENALVESVLTKLEAVGAFARFAWLPWLPSLSEHITPSTVNFLGCFLVMTSVNSHSLMESFPAPREFGARLAIS